MSVRKLWLDSRIFCPVIACGLSLLAVAVLPALITQPAVEAAQNKDADYSKITYLEYREKEDAFWVVTESMPREAKYFYIDASKPRAQLAVNLLLQAADKKWPVRIAWETDKKGNPVHYPDLPDHWKIQSIHVKVPSK